MNKVFILKNQIDGIDTSCCNIATLLGLKKAIKGQIGLEVEVEGNMFPKGPEHFYDEDEEHDNEVHLIPSQWQYTHDGSLRGEDNAEYIFAKPLMFNEVPQALDDLWKMFKDYGSVLDDSHRTSVHVHLNAQEFYLNRLCSFAAIYFSVEEILTEWCGDHRVGNLFCLRAKDAPAIIGKMKQFLVTGNLNVFDDGLHYAAFNPHSLVDKGSIEIRTMRGTQDPNLIKTWVGVLERLYFLSEDYPDPRDICEGFSGGGYSRFLHKILGPYADEVIKGSGMSEDDIRKSMYEGIRMAQNLCYCRNWSADDFKAITPDPFGRKIAQVVEPVPVGYDVEENAYQMYTASQLISTSVVPIPIHWGTDAENNTNDYNSWIDEFIAEGEQF